MPQKIALSFQTLFADLIQRLQDTNFAYEFNRSESFSQQERGGRFYWYSTYRDGGKVKKKYVGPVENEALTERVRKHGELKTDHKELRSIVRSLKSAGLPAPDPITGRVVQALSEAGFFRLRGVLVGTTAFQCYSGIVGARLPNAALRTQDADFAQYFAISQEVGDSIPPIIDVLHNVDETFRPVPHISGDAMSTTYMNEAKYRVEFLTPNRGKDEYQDKPAKMPALGGAGAQNLRFLDFLIRGPIHSALLFETGVPVCIPSPERYLVHKLIVATRRTATSRAKADKDISQASALLEVMSDAQPLEVTEAWQEAWNRGEGWRKAMLAGTSRLSSENQNRLKNALKKGSKILDLDVQSFFPM